MALLNNGAQINMITPRLVEKHSLDVGPLTDQVGGQVTCVGLGNVLTQNFRLHHHMGLSGWSPGL